MIGYTEISCASPESAHALHAYLLVELGQEDDGPKISARVDGSTLKVTHEHDSPQVRQEWDVQLIGYRDGRESLEPVLRQLRDDLQHQPDVIRLIDSALGIKD